MSLLQTLGIFTSPTGSLLRDLSARLTALRVTASEHGDEAITATAALGLDDSFLIYDRPALPWVEVSNGGAPTAAGRLEDVTIGDGTLELTALGPWQAFSDLPYTAAWSVTQYDRWEELTNNQIGSARPDKYETDTTDRLFVHLKEGEQYAHNADLAIWGLRRPSGDPGGFAGLMLTLTINLPVGWTVRAQTRDEQYSAAGAVQILTFSCVSPITYTQGYLLTFTQAASIIIYAYNATGAAYTPAAGSDYYVSVTAARAVRSTANMVNTTISVGSVPGSPTAFVTSTAGIVPGMLLLVAAGGSYGEILTVLSVNTGASSVTFTAAPATAFFTGEAVQGFVISAGQVIKDMRQAITAVNTMLQPSDALIQSPELDLTDAWYEDASMATVAQDLAVLGDRSNQRWRISVGRDRYVRFAPVGTDARDWYADASDPALQRSLQELVNSVYAVYQETGGRRIVTTTAADSASATRFGLTRRRAARADTTTTAVAESIRDTTLADGKDAPPRASITVTALFDAYGMRWPLDAVRPGDTLTIRNLPPGVSNSIDAIRTFRIGRTELDRLAGSLVLEPETALPRLDVLLARRAAGVER